MRVLLQFLEENQDDLNGVREVCKKDLEGIPDVERSVGRMVVPRVLKTLGTCKHKYVIRSWNLERPSRVLQQLNPWT